MAWVIWASCPANTSNTVSLAPLAVEMPAVSCSQGATKGSAASPGDLACKAMSPLAAVLPTQPDRAMQLAWRCALCQADCRLAGVPSVSSVWCCTGRPCTPPLALISCQAVREPTRKSRLTSCWSADRSATCATTWGRSASAFLADGSVPWAQTLPVRPMAATPCSQWRRRTPVWPGRGVRVMSCGWPVTSWGASARCRPRVRHRWWRSRRPASPWLRPP